MFTLPVTLLHPVATTIADITPDCPQTPFPEFSTCAFSPPSAPTQHTESPRTTRYLITIPFPIFLDRALYIELNKIEVKMDPYGVSSGAQPGEGPTAPMVGDETIGG